MTQFQDLFPSQTAMNVQRLLESYIRQFKQCGKDTGQEVEEPSVVHPELGCQIERYRKLGLQRHIKEKPAIVHKSTQNTPLTTESTHVHRFGKSAI